MSDVLVGAYSIVCGVLLVSGAFKVVQPGGVTLAVGSLGLSAPQWTGRLLGLAELGLGAIGLAVAGALSPVFVGIAYLGFAVVVIALLRRGEAGSCGCFGRIESPPSVVHVVFDLAAATIAFGTAAAGWEGIGLTAEDLGGRFLPFAGLVMVGVVCAVAVITVLPAVAAETRAAAGEADSRHERLHHHDDGIAVH